MLHKAMKLQFMRAHLLIAALSLLSGKAAFALQSQNKIKNCIRSCWTNMLIGIKSLLLVKGQNGGAIIV